MHSETYILPLSSPSVTFENAGGKGASLARLAGIGQPVPPGFIVVTDAYRRFVTENNLAGVIAAALNGLAAEELEALERASAQIRAAFSAGAIPQAISAALKDAYQQLGAQPGGAAVRSSATTEDLPDLSFAGQQDTFLNILGEAALLKAVVDCWSSLWTGRAIGYRMRSAIAHEQAALAVVVQQMVASEVSGVLFTANPLSGLRSEAVIDAAFGLGEALVSGQVEPDHYVVDAVQGEIRSVTLGSKRVATRPRPGGGVENAAEDNAARQTLSADQARRLAAAGQQIQQAYGAPQDIEWAFAGGELFILQSRPITSLFPIPRVSVDPLLVWFSFGSFQGIVGPLTPLGQEAIQRVVLGIGKKLGLAIKLEEQDVLTVAGERLWVRLDDVLRHPVGGRILSGFLGIGEPGSARLLSQLAPDARLGIGQGRLRWSSMRRALQFTLPALRDIPRTLLQPEKARARFDAQVDAYLQTVQIAGGADRFERLANFAAFVEAQKGLAEALPLLLQRFMPVMAPSLALLNLISHLLPAGEADGPGITMSALDVTRGLPQNVTTEMDLMLWKIAVQIKADAPALAAFQSADAPTLAGRYLQGTLPASAQAWMQDFMERYGMRGVGEIDLGQPRWREAPTPILQTLQSYLQIPPEAAPDLLFARNVRAAEEAIERMAVEVRKQRGGRLKEKILRGAARRVRLLLGARESPKFCAIRAMGIMRKTLLEIGEEFAAAGTIVQRDDLFFLHVSELQSLARGEAQDWQALIAARRQAYGRELRRRQVPRLLLSDGRVFYDGIGAGEDSPAAISGSPVSPGVVEGKVRVILHPHGAQLAPGEIMVCPGTDPAWTPLFMVAGGLIMEVGGMMTHGSVVAREYGIPAVVGVHQATQRLRDGQRIRLDGSRGKIMLLDEAAAG